MPTPWQRDLDRDRAQLTRWLEAKLAGAKSVEVSNLRSPQSSGFSNDTLLFELAYEQDGARREEALVARIQPTGFQVFPEYDMALQFDTMRLLADTDVPVPPVRWMELEDESIVGAPFYVMGQVAGRVPTDNPPYHVDGWLKTEATPAEREAIWLASFDCMAKIHRLDYAATGFDFLDQPQPGQTALERQLDDYGDYLRWAARGRRQPTVEAAFDWLQKHKPSDEPTVLSWGDSRIGNIIFDGVRPAAVIDWEMVGLGSPEQDVAWQIFLDRHHSEGVETPRLPGFPSYEETLAYYTERSGFDVKHLDYYQIFAGFRFGVVMIRLAQQMGEYSVMPAEVAEKFEVDNIVTRLLARIMELPPPSEAS